MAKKVELTINQRVLKNVSAAVNPVTLTWFDVRPHWPNGQWPAAAGPQPSPEMLAVGAAFSTRGAGAESGFVALQLRETGCSIFELGQAYNCGPANNHSRDLMRAGYFERTSKPYKLTFTPKGEVDLYRRLGLGVDGKPVKPAKAPAAVKVARKRNKATEVAVTETPISEPATVTGGVRLENPRVIVTDPAANLRVSDTSLPATTESLAELAKHFNS